MKIVEFQNQDELLASFSNGDLRGLIPAEKIDTYKIEYPVRIEILDDLKMFKLYKEVEKIKVAEPIKKKGLSKKAILGLSIGIPLGVIVIVAIVLICVL